MEQEKFYGNVNPTIKQDSSNNEELIKKIEIENTPFTAIWSEDKEWNLLMGRYRIAGPFEKEEEVKEAAKDVSWETLLKVMQALIEINKKLDEEVKKMEEVHGKTPKMWEENLIKEARENSNK